MNKNKNLRPLLFWTLIGITLVSALLFVIAKVSDNRPVPVPITDNKPVSKIEYWADENADSIPTYIHHSTKADTRNTEIGG